jgi:hypothetical protein
MKIRPVVTEFFHADRRTDRRITKQIDDFSKPATAPKNGMLENCAIQILDIRYSELSPLLLLLLSMPNRHRSVGKVTCYTLDQVEVDCRQGNDYS